MSIVLSSCSGYKKTTPVIVNNYCDLQIAFPKSPNVDKDVMRAAFETFKYIEITAATRKCECKDTKEQKDKCWQQFHNLKKQ